MRERCGKCTVCNERRARTRLDRCIGIPGTKLLLAQFAALDPLEFRGACPDRFVNPFLSSFGPPSFGFDNDAINRVRSILRDNFYDNFFLIKVEREIFTFHFFQ